MAAGTKFRALCSIGLVVFALCAPAGDSAPVFRVTSVVLRPDGRLDKRTLEQCDVTRIVTESVQRFRPKGRLKGSQTTDLVLRVDRIAKVSGTFSGDFGGTDLAITLVSADSREMNQAFLCRANRFATLRNPSHCQRLDYCGEKIADQISSWLSWQKPE